MGSHDKSYACVWDFGPDTGYFKECNILSHHTLNLVNLMKRARQLSYDTLNLMHLTHPKI
jgi:hypothetical protein